jgi:integrase
MSPRKHPGTVYPNKTKTGFVGRFEDGSTASGGRRRRMVSGRTESEVWEKLRKLEAEILSGRPVADGSLRVDALFARWMKHEIESSNRSVNTIDNYEGIIRNHILPAFGKMRLRDLTVADVETLLYEKRQTGLSDSTVIRIRTDLKKALQYAERHDLVGRNVAALSEIPKSKRRNGRSLTIQQAQALIESAEGDRLEIALKLGLMLGLRPGEALGLTWADIDFDRGHLSVRRALLRERNQLRLGDPKTPTSHRTLAIQPALRTALLRQKVRQVRERLVAGEYWQNFDLVSATQIGTPVDFSNLRRSLDRICSRAEIGHWSPNELRHSFASIASLQGVRIEDLADSMGHADVRMTSQKYRHQLKPVIDTASAAMGALFEPVSI